MLSTYCQDCGGKNEYSVVKPKFCSSCGQPLAGHLNQASTQIKAKTYSSSSSSVSRFSKGEIENYDEDGSDVFEVPDISELQYEIEVSNTSNFTLGSILPRQESPEVKSAPKKKRGRPKKNG